MISVVSRPIGDRALSPNSQSDSAAAGATTDVTEEVVVVGDRSLATIRAQIRQAEDQVFSLFNDLNDDDDYDIVCRLEKPTGSLISRRVCKPNFVGEATAVQAAATLNLLRGQMGNAAPPANAVVQYKNGILREKMVAIVKENPELFQAVVRYGELQSELESARQNGIGSGEN